MNKKNIIILIILILVVAAITGFFIKNKPGTGKEGIILYYGAECPHCVKVEDFIKANKIAEKVSFVEKEVSYNQINAADLGKKAASCGLATNSIGVPFLWDGSRCITGDIDVINFFRQKAGIN
ncbi:MAG: Uncharacterized protein Athens071426_183 [Parcubacteria group bacterium Athens0714_26]|nr:MAG: Uncharacterized protein Athens101426_409 [Parcubacteria group bacterium Athens1014_26]TSD03586.1 MAG: Uncharacterized protein Athens071426_183 [Parcubacteria group bacterium Athens0714_26]